MKNKTLKTMLMSCALLFGEMLALSMPLSALATSNHKSIHLGASDPAPQTASVEGKQTSTKAKKTKKTKVKKTKAKKARVKSTAKRRRVTKPQVKKPTKDTAKSFNSLIQSVYSFVVPNTSSQVNKSTTADQLINREQRN